MKGLNLLSHLLFCPVNGSISQKEEGVHLILPPHVPSVQVKSRSTLHHGSVGANPNPNP